MTDTITYIGTILFLIFIAWFASRETKKSLNQERRSKKTIEEERNMLEERIGQRTNELMRAEREKTAELERIAEFGNLSQGLFHDLMSPLSSITLYLEHMSKPDNAEEVQHMIGKTVQASRRMNSFMETVRHSMRTGAEKTQPQTVVHEELSLVQDMLAYKARMAGVVFKVHMSPSLILLINPIRLHQLFLNLLSNAIDACSTISNQTSSTIDHVVEVSGMKDEKNIIIRISDTGCGIAADQLSRIFTHPFTTKSNGTGVGLATVKSIIEDELKGTIEVTSTIGKGTTFSIRIPHSLHK